MCLFRSPLLLIFAFRSLFSFVSFLFPFVNTNQLAPNLQFFEFLLKRGADLNFEKGGVACSVVDSLLMKGLTAARIPLLKWLLEHGASLVIGAYARDTLNTFVR